MNDQTNQDNDAGEHGGLPVLAGGGGMTAMMKAEIDMQITTARAYPRAPKKVQNMLLELVTLDEASAEEATYALPRGGKPIKGPSIRFAESVKQAWGNCRAATEITEINKDLGYVEAVGVFHDLQTNVITRIPHRRRITGRNGRVFPDDMILVTANAASSIAMRECILKGVPKPIWRSAYDAVEKVISGDVKTLAVNRDTAIKAFARFGVKPEQVFEALGVAAEEDIILDHIAVLRGMFAALKNGEETVESMFAKRGAKDVDPHYTPLTRHDPKTGEVTEDPISTGGKKDEVTDTQKEGDHRAESTSSAENRSAAEQQVSQAGEARATESKDKASDKPAPTDAGTSPETSGSSQPDLGTGENGSKLASASGPKPADESGGEVRPSLEERFRSYARALGGISDPAKLVRQAQTWIKRFGEFEDSAVVTRDAIYNLHLKRVTGDITAEDCQKQVEKAIAG